MKKIFTTLLVLTGIYTASHAQNKGQVAFGASVGVNGSYAISNAKYASGTDTRLDPSFSLQGEYFVDDHWSLKAEAIYNPKGWGNGIYDDGTKQVINVNYNINYITVPVLVTWHIGVEKLWFVNFGPYISFLTSASNDYDHADLKSAYKSTEEGAHLGLGIQFPLSLKNDRTKIFFEYGWEIGASNVLANSADGGATLMRHGLGAGIRF